MRKDKGDETPRDADEEENCRRIVEGRRMDTRRREVAARRKDMRGIKPRLGLESGAAAKKFM